jgi:hypothetical protein
MVSLSLSCGTWLRALEHVPQERLKETFRLAKALAKMRVAAKNDLIKEPRRGQVVLSFLFFFAWSPPGSYLAFVYFLYPAPCPGELIDWDYVSRRSPMRCSS